MKKLITFLSAFLICSSLSLAQENKLTVGAGVGTSNHFYNGDSITFPIPVFDVRYDNFFISGWTMGYDIYNEDDLTMSLFLNPLDGFPIKGSKMDSGYKNIDERKTQAAVGMVVSYKLDFYDMTALVAVSGGERGMKGETRIFKPFRVTDSFALIPSIGASFYSSDYTDYYFGIDSNELDRKITETYSPSTAYSIGLNLSAEYYLNDKITLLAFLSADKFSSEISDSPIIDNSTLFLMGVGAKYSF